jgi:hypothetical protein
MFDSLGWSYFIVMGTALVLLCLVAPPLLAARKGYAWYRWTIACGALGLIVMAFLPFANRGDSSPEVNQGRRQVGNTVGAVLSVTGLLGILAAAVNVLALGL